MTFIVGDGSQEKTKRAHFVKKATFILICLCSLLILAGTANASTAESYGAAPTADAATNTAAIQAALDDGGHATLLTAGTYKYNGNLQIGSNTWLELGSDVTLQLDTYASKYLIVNKNMTTGDHDIKITGGTWIGDNGFLANRSPGNPITDLSYYYGWGFFLYNVTTLELGNTGIITTNAWATAFFYDDNLWVHDIVFRQNAYQTLHQNEDGVHVTGCNNVIIENISGYTSDDMIAVFTDGNTNSYGGGPDMELPNTDSDNVTIRNVYAQMYYNGGTGRPLCLAVTNGNTMSNVRIENISGWTNTESFIRIGNPWPPAYGYGYGYLRNVVIDNVTAAYYNAKYSLGSLTNASAFHLSYANIDNITVTNFHLKDNGSAIVPLVREDCSIITNDHIDVQGYHYVDYPNSAKTSKTAVNHDLGLFYNDTTLIDRGGSGIGGKFITAGSYTYPIPSGQIPATGRTYFTFNGVNQSLQSNTSVAGLLTNNTCGYSCWIYRDVDSGAAEYVGQIYSSGYALWTMQITSDDLLRFSVDNYTYVYSDINIPANTNDPYFVFGTWDGTNLNIYVNGEIVASGCFYKQGSKLPTVSSNFYVGAYHGSGWTYKFNGRVIYPKLYTHPYTSGEILSAYEYEYNDLFLPTITLHDTNVSAIEGQNVTLTLSTNASTEPMTVIVTGIDGTAKAGVDYEPASQTVTIPAGATSATATIRLLPDYTTEENKSFSVMLSSINATMGMNATCDIQDLDGGFPTVQFDSATYTVNENAGNCEVTLSLSKPSLTAVTVDVATSDITAQAGTDYTAYSSTITFIPGETSKTVSLKILNPKKMNGSVQFNVTLSNAVGATLYGNTYATVTINDNWKEVSQPVQAAGQGALINGLFTVIGIFFLVFILAIVAVGLWVLGNSVNGDGRGAGQGMSLLPGILFAVVIGIILIVVLVVIMSTIISIGI